VARGAFQGTFQPGIRPTIVTAPDALVYINGELDIMGCPSCHRKFDLGKYITSISVDLSVDSAPGSANISLSIPHYALDDFFFDGVPVLTEMMEVEIFAKGYFLIEGLPQYYPIFWGLITEVSEGYSGGEVTVTIQCADILKWWDLCQMNVNSAFTVAAGQMGKSIFGNVFYGLNPYDVIWSLAQQSFGDVVIGTGSLTSLYKEGAQKRTFTNALGDIMRYWNERFSRIRSNLLLYGTQGIAVRGDSLYDTYRANKEHMGPFASRAVRTANGGASGTQMVYDPTDPNVVAFRTQFSQAGQVNFWQSEYQTKMELANSAKDAIGYEFYMDVTGDIVFKPPFYNLDILSNKPISWIQDIDVIDYDLSSSESEVVTQVVLQGNFGGNVDYGMPEECTPFTSVTDYHLLRKYGWRSKPFNSEFLADPQLMFYTGLDLIDRMNTKRHRGTVTMPMRPELRLGFPVYLAGKDQIWYVTGISHNIQFGGRAQTVLTLTARRSKFISPKGIGQLKLTSYGKPPAPSGQSSGAPAQGQGNQPGGTGGAQPAPNTSAPSEKIGYSSKQLAANATFQLKTTNAVTLPAEPLSEDGNNSNYDPVVLRHPKTGRIMGYPNVVMVYTRPFTASPPNLAAARGQKPQGKGSAPGAKRRKEISQAGPGAVQEVNKLGEASNSDRIRDQHLTNRYSYGLNSAGVYIYAYDQGKNGHGVVQEMLLIDKARVKVDGETGFTGKTGMIRPVSDERGFELIGHFRYGRGASLRDGSLILTGGKNTQVDVGSQVALAGDLQSSLIAQSQGLTSVFSSYASPADALARLQPDDLGTAAVVNPETGQPEMVHNGTNFVDTAPLGSPEQKGTLPSIEATQLSRALTLTEMTVREGQVPGETSASCHCLTGRSELAFMNVGYQVKTLNGTVADDSALPTSITAADAETQAAVDSNTPISSSKSAGSREDLISKVDKFLYNLYAVLDAPHVEYETAIRGGNLPKGKAEDTEAWRFEKPVQEYGNLEPPFSAPNRDALGDPQATMQQFDSARSDIQNQWNSFGDKLKSNAKKAQLRQEIANLQGELSIKASERAKLIARIENNPGSSGDLQAQLATLDAAIEKQSQELAHKQQELAVEMAKSGGG
jgi:hypothetical protein